MVEYCYIVHVREFVNTNQNIYRIGKTKQKNIKRFEQYPKGSCLIIQIEVDNCDIFEQQIIHLFNIKYIKRKNIGTKYYQGNIQNMIYDFLELYKLQCTKI